LHAASNLQIRQRQVDQVFYPATKVVRFYILILILILILTPFEPKAMRVSYKKSKYKGKTLLLS
jgi:hypothetical protein